MHIKNKRGQSTVEYILLVTAVVAVIIALVSSSNSGFQTQLNTTLNTAVGEMSSEATQLDSSHNPSNATGITSPGYTVNVNAP